MDTLYYCGFNGFQQVPGGGGGGATAVSGQSGPPLTTLTPHGRHTKCGGVVDVAVCWNYLVVADEDGCVTKYGLVNGGRQNGTKRLEAPVKGAKIRQLSATPRHLLVCTTDGECFTHEEGKGWRRVNVGAELPTSPSQLQSPSAEESSGGSSINNRLKSSNGKKSGSSTPEDEVGSGEAVVDDASPPANSHVELVKTTCGDNHNLGLDASGVPYSLPSPLEFDASPPESARERVTDVVCGKEHCLMLTESGRVYSWGGGSRGQLGHGTLSSESSPRLITALDGLRITKIAAGGWHSACISQFDDLYMFGWNESGQLAQTTNLAKPAECFSAVEKLLMACCTMQPEDAAQPRGGVEDCEVYHKPKTAAASAGDGDADDANSISEAAAGERESSFAAAVVCGGGSAVTACASSSSADVDNDLEKEALTCYNAAAAAACGSDDQTDTIIVQNVPMLVQIPDDGKVVDVGCGSRHTVVLTSTNQLYGFGWNKYGQLGQGHTISSYSADKLVLPKGLFTKQNAVKFLRCGDWGTALVVTAAASPSASGEKHGKS